MAVPTSSPERAVWPRSGEKRCAKGVVVVFHWLDRISRERGPVSASRTWEVFLLPVDVLQCARKMLGDGGAVKRRSEIPIASISLWECVEGPKPQCQRIAAVPWKAPQRYKVVSGQSPAGFRPQTCSADRRRLVHQSMSAPYFPALIR